MVPQLRPARHHDSLGSRRHCLLPGLHLQCRRLDHWEVHSTHDGKSQHQACPACECSPTALGPRGVTRCVPVLRGALFPLVPVASPAERVQQVFAASVLRRLALEALLWLRGGYRVAPQSALIRVAQSAEKVHALSKLLLSTFYFPFFLWEFLFWLKQEPR